MGSGNYSKYSFSSSDGDVDFYGNDPLYPKILTTSESSLTVEGTKISHASASLSASATSSVTALEIQLASPNFDGDVATVTIALEILKGQIFLDGDTTLAVSGTKEAYASSALSGSGTLTSTALEILIPGVDSASGDVDVVVAGTKVATASASVSITSDSTSNAIRIPGINIAMSGSASLTAVALKQAYSAVQISDGDGQLNAEAFKFAYSSSGLSISNDLTATSLKQAYSSTSTSGSGSASATALEILLTGSVTSGAAVSFITAKEIVFGRATLSGTVSSPLSNVIPGVVVLSAETRMVAGATKFSPSITEDVQTIRTLVSIDGKPLSEHNRKFQSSIIQSFVENRNWAASRSRYYKASSGRKTFSISWTMLPSERHQTVDNRFGRDRIHSIASDPDVHTLKMLNLDSDGTTPYTETEYNVLVKSYTENLVRRDINNDMYLWDCSIELEEV